MPRISSSWFFALAFCAATICPLFAASASPCGVSEPCAVASGSYLARAPAGWDGKSALPMIVFFHGAFSDAQDSMGREDLRKAADGVGALFVAMDGANRNWAFPGKMPQNARDDFAYVREVLDDAAQRFPIDKAHVLASGFSVGGSMTWYIACVMGDRFTAFAPVAGAYWEPMPETCPSGAAALRHVHGMADATVPMKGRSLRNGAYKQGDVMESFRRLRERNGCGEAPDSTQEKDGLTCRTWAAKSCASGREAVLCLHSGEHVIDGQWVADGFRWMQGLERR